MLRQTVTLAVFVCVLLQLHSADAVKTVRSVTVAKATTTVYGAFVAQVQRIFDGHPEIKSIVTFGDADTQGPLHDMSHSHMEAQQADVWPRKSVLFDARQSSRKIGKFRGENVTETATVKVGLVDIEMTVGRDTGLVYLVDNATQVTRAGDTVTKFPNLIKVIAMHGQCARMRPHEMPGTLNLEAFAADQWRKRRVLHLHFVTVCTDTETIIVNFYNPFERVVGKGAWGALTATDTATATAINASRSIQSMAHWGPLSLNGYPLRVILFPTTMAFLKREVKMLERTLSTRARDNPYNSIEAYFGVDVSIFKELAVQMNFTPSIMQTSDGRGYGFREPSGRLNGALGDIIEGRAEFIMNGFFVKDYETRKLEFSTAVNEDKLCIIVRTADLIPNSLLIFRAFAVHLWLIILATVLGVGAIYSLLLCVVARFPHFQQGVDDHWLIGRQQEQAAVATAQQTNDNYRHHITGWHDQITAVVNAPFRILAVMLGAPVEGIGTSVSERFFIGICFLWSLNMSGSFQGSLVDVYTTPLSYPNIDTLDALDASGIPIAVRHQGLIVDIFGSEKPGTPLGNLKQKLVPSTNDALCGEIANGVHLAGLERLVDVPRVGQNLIRSDGVFLLHTVRECPRTYSLAYLFPKASPLLDTANFHLQRFSEVGLMRKWFSDVMYVFELQAGLRNRNYIRDGKVTLSLNHLQIAFIILGIGIGGSVIVFLIEQIASCRCGGDANKNI